MSLREEWVSDLGRKEGHARGPDWKIKPGDVVCDVHDYETTSGLVVSVFDGPKDHTQRALILWSVSLSERQRVEKLLARGMANDIADQEDKLILEALMKA